MYRDKIFVTANYFILFLRRKLELTSSRTPYCKIFSNKWLFKRSFKTFMQLARLVDDTVHFFTQLSIDIRVTWHKFLQSENISSLELVVYGGPNSCHHAVASSSSCFLYTEYQLPPKL